MSGRTASLTDCELRHGLFDRICQMEDRQTRVAGCRSRERTHKVFGPAVYLLSDHPKNRDKMHRAALCTWANLWAGGRAGAGGSCLAHCQVSAWDGGGGENRYMLYLGERRGDTGGHKGRGHRFALSRAITIRQRTKSSVCFKQH